MKLSGFPPNRVIGLGTFLDSCKFQYYIAEQLNVSPSSIQALVVGENSSNSGIDNIYLTFIWLIENIIK